MVLWVDQVVGPSAGISLGTVTKLHLAGGWLGSELSLNIWDSWTSLYMVFLSYMVSRLLHTMATFQESGDRG